MPCAESSLLFLVDTEAQEALAFFHEKRRLQIYSYAPLGTEPTAGDARFTTKLRYRFGYGPVRAGCIAGLGGGIRLRYPPEQAVEAGEGFLGEPHRALELVVAFEGVRMALPAAVGFPVDEAAQP